MVNIYNRVQVLDKLPGPVLMNGIVPVTPANQLTMLTDYVDPGWNASSLCPIRTSSTALALSRSIANRR